MESGGASLFGGPSAYDADGMTKGRPIAARLWLAAFFALLLLMLWSLPSRVVINGSGWRFGFNEGRFGVDTWDPKAAPAGVVPAGPWYIHGYATDMRPLRWWDAGTYPMGVRYFYVTILPLLPIPLLVSIYLWPRGRRFGPGLCPECGYDRRGLATEAPCPECGKKQ